MTTSHNLADRGVTVFYTESVERMTNLLGSW